MRSIYSAALRNWESESRRSRNWLRDEARYQKRDGVGPRCCILKDGLDGLLKRIGIEWLT
jgi:hypothetical protein